MKRIYFAAPLFNEMELKRNEEYTILLEIFIDNYYLLAGGNLYAGYARCYKEIKR